MPVILGFLFEKMVYAKSIKMTKGSVLQFLQLVFSKGFLRGTATDKGKTEPEDATAATSNPMPKKLILS